MEKVIIVSVEGIGKKFRLKVGDSTKVSDVLEKIKEAASSEGVDLAKWAEGQLGHGRAALNLMRKSMGNLVLAPAVNFAALDPPVEEDEAFSLDAEGIVGK